MPPKKAPAKSEKTKESERQWKKLIVTCKKTMNMYTDKLKKASIKKSGKK